MTYRNTKESKRALELCGWKCVICGWEEKGPRGNRLIEGCHIKALSNGKEDDIYQNIIALCPNHHTEFDQYCFYIEPKTHKIKHYNNKYLNYILDINYVEDKYLAYRQYRVKKYWKEIRLHSDDKNGLEQ